MTVTMRPPNSIKLYLALVFISGILVGGVGVQLFGPSSASGANPDDARRKYTEEMRTRLQLSDEQAAMLDRILEDTHQRFLALREKWRPEMKALGDDQAARIRQMLNDKQRKEYEKMRQEREEQRRRSHPESSDRKR